uniref:Uncharacterized protein n=1 Tax=Candidatus Kentrum sp. FW TaxID=2126338 RepID=A0A450TIY2_9GAMM|nr:MAG: hypothetical protein BECKFW1821C_GA0114237_101153 [Candidatus Kentron sp. FW]
MNTNHRRPINKYIIREDSMRLQKYRHPEELSLQQIFYFLRIPLAFLAITPLLADSDVYAIGGLPANAKTLE